MPAKAMSKVVMHNVVSVDGFIADDNDDVGPLFEWHFNGDHPLIPGQMDEPSPGSMKVSKVSFDYVRSTWDAIGSMVIGQSRPRRSWPVSARLRWRLAAGDVDGQVLALGLVDEVAMDVVPAVFGLGKRYFGTVDRQHLLEDPDVVIEGNRVLHLRYRVRR